MQKQPESRLCGDKCIFFICVELEIFCKYWKMKLLHDNEATNARYRAKWLNVTVRFHDISCRILFITRLIIFSHILWNRSGSIAHRPQYASCHAIEGMQCIIVNVMWNGNMWKRIDFVCKSMPALIICTHRVNNSLAIGRYSRIRMEKSCFYLLLLLSWRSHSHLCAPHELSPSPLAIPLPFILPPCRSPCLFSARLRLVRWPVCACEYYT